MISQFFFVIIFYVYINTKPLWERFCFKIIQLFGPYMLQNFSTFYYFLILFVERKTKILTRCASCLKKRAVLTMLLCQNLFNLSKTTFYKCVLRYLIFILTT